MKMTSKFKFTCPLLWRVAVAMQWQARYFFHFRHPHNNNLSLWHSLSPSRNSLYDFLYVTHYLLYPPEIWHSKILALPPYEFNSWLTHLQWKSTRHFTQKKILLTPLKNISARKAKKDFTLARFNSPEKCL